MALRALPLLHTKLKAVPSGSSGLGHNGAAVPSSDAAKKSNSGSRKSAPATHGDDKAEAAPSADQPNDSHESSRKSTPTTNGEATTEAGAKHPDLMPLDFLLSVMRHPKTPATLRIKVALATQPYIHPRKSNRPTSPVAAAGDRHGFEVEPAMAKKLRNEIARLGKLKRRRNPRPEDQKTEQKLHQKTCCRPCCSLRPSAASSMKARFYLERSAAARWIPHIAWPPDAARKRPRGSADLTRNDVRPFTDKQ